MERISGIYAIVNTVNGKQYIGASINILARWGGHKYSLRKNLHHSVALQCAWNKYGSENFRLDILERAGEEYLNEREQEYILSLNPEYNINNAVAPNTWRHSDEAKQKMRDAAKWRPSASRRGVGRKKGTGLKLTPEQVIEARQWYARGATVSVLANWYDVSRTVIYACLKKDKGYAAI